MHVLPIMCLHKLKRKLKLRIFQESSYKKQNCQKINKYKPEDCKKLCFEGSGCLKRGGRLLFCSLQALMHFSS